MIDTSAPKLTLKDVMPREFIGGEYTDTRAFALRDATVEAQHSLLPGDQPKAWIGPQKHVHFWCVVRDGKGRRYAVAFNENPSRGWSFPVISYPTQG